MNGQLSSHEELLQELQRLRRRVAELEAVEEVRQESEQRYRLINQTISDYAFSFHRQTDGTFVLDWLTESFTKLTGYPVSDLLGKPNPFHTYIHPDDLDRVVQTLATIQPDAPINYEFRMVTQAGDIRWLHSFTRAMSDETGQIIGFYGATRDITERREAEAELALTSEVLDKVFSNSVLGIAILDTDFTFLRVNQVYAAFDSHLPEFYVGKSHFALYPNAENEALFRRVVETGEPYLASERPFVYTNHPERGATYWDLNLQPLTDTDGHPWGLALWLIDVTQRKQAKVWRQQLLEITQDAFIAIDRSGHMRQFNRAAEQIFGYTAADVVGQKVNMLMPEPYVSEHDGYIERYQRTREPHAIGQIRTVSAKRKNGEVFPIELSVTEVAVDGDTRYGAFIRDISEKVRLQEQMVERERLAAIGTTAAKLAHEIGNPLNSMSASAQLLERRFAKLGDAGDVVDERIVTYTRNMQGSIRRLTGLLQEFRSVSRRQTFAFQPLALTDVVADILTAETADYQARGVTVEQSFPADLPPLSADADKLKQVFLNLCKNAVEAMPDGGTLSIRAQYSAEQVSVDITDTGQGIPDGVDIFELFATTKAEGTGLGLPIVQQIIGAHGGTIDYTSEPGQGTTFTVVLPLTLPDTETSQA